MKAQSSTLERALNALRSICESAPAVMVDEPAPLSSQAPSPHLPGLNPARDQIPPQDPAEWRQPFIWWLDSTCALHSRWFGGVAALHLSFCQWEIDRDEVPCNRRTFERLLDELGFVMGEVEGTLLVSGLALRKDLELVGFSDKASS